MATAAALKSVESLSGVDARMEALDRLEQLADEAAAEIARHKSNLLLKRGIRAWRRGEIVRAGQWALKATEIDASNSKAFHVLAMALERMGHAHKALVTYERAYELDPADPELLINLGLTAWNLKLTEAAARMFHLYINACPHSPLGYNNLGSVLYDLGHPEAAIETLTDAIQKMPRGSDPVEFAGHRAGRGWAGPRKAWSSTMKRSGSSPALPAAITIWAMPISIWAGWRRRWPITTGRWSCAVDPTERLRNPPFAQHLPDRRRPAGRGLPRI